MGNCLRKLARAIISYARHPFGVTCLDCGFLALGEKEVSTADRILLDLRGSMGLPPLDKLCCSRFLWVDYELTYIGIAAEGIFDEVQKQRRDCPGFFRYRPGWSPNGHRDFLLKALARKEKIAFAVLGSMLTLLLMLLVSWLEKRFGLS